MTCFSFVQERERERYEISAWNKIKRNLYDIKRKSIVNIEHQVHNCLKFNVQIR